MEQDLVILILSVLVLALIDAASIRWGVDSREGSHDPRNQEHPIALK